MDGGDFIAMARVGFVLQVRETRIQSLRQSEDRREENLETGDFFPRRAARLDHFDRPIRSSLVKLGRIGFVLHTACARSATRIHERR
jgi:hypothetical protein